MDDTTDDTVLDGRVKLTQPARGYRAGVDAALLAAACDAKAGERVIEAGCGAGAALLAAAMRREGVSFTGVERDPAAAALARANVTANGLAERVDILEGDGPFKRIARLKHSGTDEIEDIEIGGAFIAVGHEPQSEIVGDQIEVDAEGYVKVDGRSTRTNRPGVFAAGDLVDHTYRQAITAAGSGCQAALDAEWYLRDTPQIPTPEGMPEGDLAEAQWAAQTA